MNDGAEAAIERRPAKSAMAFRTISEVAGELDVPAHVLRFWESKFTQVRPLKRGGGRRYYRPEDVDLLRSIRELLYTDGYTIRGVQKLLREGGAKAVNAQAQAETVMQPAPARASAPAPFAPDGAEGGGHRIRAELREILTELESLRDLLRRSI